MSDEITTLDDDSDGSTLEGTALLADADNPGLVKALLDAAALKIWLEDTRADEGTDDEVAGSSELNAAGVENEPEVTAEDSKVDDIAADEIVLDEEASAVDAAADNIVLDWKAGNAELDAAANEVIEDEGTATEELSVALKANIDEGRAEELSSAIYLDDDAKALEYMLLEATPLGKGLEEAAIGG